MERFSWSFKLFLNGFCLNTVSNSDWKTGDQTKGRNHKWSDKENKVDMAYSGSVIVQYFKGIMGFINLMVNIYPD